MVPEVERLDEVAAVFRGVLRDGAEEAAREGAARVVPFEEGAELLAREGADEGGIDDGVEGDVVDLRGMEEEPRVAEEGVVELVEDEHEEVLGGLAPLLEELRVQEELGAIPAGHGRAIDPLLLEAHAEEAEELLHVEGVSWDHLVEGPYDVLLGHPSISSFRKHQGVSNLDAE